jgi:hypothetical protein
MIAAATAVTTTPNESAFFIECSNRRGVPPRPIRSIREFGSV